MRELMEKAQKTVAGLSRETPEVMMARAQLADVLALANLSLGDPAAAQRFAETEAALMDALVARDPANIAWQRLWALSRTRLGNALYWLGDGAGSLKQLRLAEQAAARLAAAHPDDDLLQRNLLDDYVHLADTLRELGDLDAAMATGRALIELAEREAAKRGATDLRWQTSVALAHQDLGDTLVLLEKWAEAGVEYQIGVSISAQVLERDPMNAGVLGVQAQSRMRLGDALWASNAAAAL